MQRDKFLVYQYVDCLISHLSTLLLLLTIKPIQRWRENLTCLQLSLMCLLLNECAFVSEEREIKELRVVCIPVFCTLTDPTAICTPTQEIPNIWDWTDTAYQQKREEWGCKFKCRQLLAQLHNPQSKTRPSLIKILVSLLDQQSPIESAQLWVRTIYFAFISGWRGAYFWDIGYLFIRSHWSRSHSQHFCGLIWCQPRSRIMQKPVPTDDQRIKILSVDVVMRLVDIEPNTMSAVAPQQYCSEYVSRFNLHASTNTIVDQSVPVGQVRSIHFLCWVAAGIGKWISVCPVICSSLLVRHQSFNSTYQSLLHRFVVRSSSMLTVCPPPSNMHRM